MSVFIFDEFAFDDVRFELRRAGVAAKADPQALELLAHLLNNHDRLVTKEELLATIWSGRAVGENVINLCVSKLRRALGGDSPRCIGSVYGRGYRFMLPVSKRAGTLPDAQPAAMPPPVSLRCADPSLVGRALAMTQLHAALASADEGHGVMVTLLGEAGIGKTRLAEALQAHARHAGFNVGWGHCHPHGDVPPLWPFLQVLRAWNMQLPAGAQSEDVGDGPSDLFEPGASNAWHKTALQMVETWAAMCSRQPQLVVFEDVQWADCASLRLLSHLVSIVARLPALIVLTVRDGQMPQTPCIRRALNHVLGHRDCTRIELKRLLKTDVAAYTSAILGKSDATMTDAVFAKSEGIPFFMVELLQPFVNGENAEPHELKVSRPALDIVRQGLQQLTPESRAVLVAAAAIGRRFDLGLLSMVTCRSPELLLELLEPSMRSHVIVTERDSRTLFAFGHNLFREVLYDEAPSIVRARLHLRVAEALERRGSTDSGASTELARHLLAALPVSDATRAITAARQAARSAASAGEHRLACTLLRRAHGALALLPKLEPRTACGLLYELAQYDRAEGEPKPTSSSAT